MIRKTLLVALFALGTFSLAFAQFEEPEIEKVPHDLRNEFNNTFESYSDDIRVKATPRGNNELGIRITEPNCQWTGRGLYNPTTIDRIPTIELRARLQAAFGEPTQTIGDLIDRESFRPGKAVQFEYWFIIDNKIPLMILDLDGPFENGLVYVGATCYIDLMPQVKRTLTRILMEAQPEEYEDYFYSPERQQWYLVQYKDGEFQRDMIDRPTFN
ncbi:MAG: hypothetical protein GVY07_16745 [Bacteroidetes bacterium]|jgi:hypothetical protein|nr:hypothetical protein [Bacteroidota bacterium]